MKIHECPGLFKESGAFSHKHLGTNATRVEMRALAAASAYVMERFFQCFIDVKSLFSMRKYVRSIFIENVQGVFIEYPGCNPRVKI